MSTAPPPAPTAAPAVRALNCPQCGGTIEMRAAGYTVSLICAHCGSTLDATDPTLRLIQAADKALKRPRIALGTRGMLRGGEWEAVGYMERRSEDGGWAEYLLFNPYRGYRFLIDDDGDFYFSTLLDRAPENIGSSGLVLGGRPYELDEESYEARVTFVVGEFYWRVAVGETVRVTDYSRNSQGLSCEENASERTWSLSDQLRPGEAEQAFGIAGGGGSPGGGTGGNDYAALLAARDRPRGAGGSRLLQACLVAIVACIALLFVSFSGGSAKLLASRDVSAPLDGPERNIVIGPIDLPDKSTAVKVRAYAPSLANSWVDLDYSLVERRTQENFDAYGIAEHYNGTDSDGDWTEGDRDPATSFAAIGQGQYDLVIDYSAHRWKDGSISSSSSSSSSSTSYSANTSYSSGMSSASQEVPIRIEVYRGAGFASNFILALLAILIWPPLVWLHQQTQARIGRGQ